MIPEKKNFEKKQIHPLEGRKLYIPRMSTGGARTMAAAFRSIGVDAHVSPEADDETFRLAARFTTGEECLPQRVVLGNFLKVTEEKNFIPGKTAFLMPTSSGPCRFGQYMNLFKKTMHELGFDDSLVFSPTSSDGYEGIAANKNKFMRTAWRALLCADILRKLLLMFRPYEKIAGAVDKAHDAALTDVCQVLSNGDLSSSQELRLLVKVLTNIHDRFLQIPLKAPLGSRPLLGVVGEIYLRFNTYSNQDIMRKVEKHGGECWIADIAEWIWYTNWEEIRKLRESGESFSLKMLYARIRHKIQLLDEHQLLKPFQELFKNRPETKADKLLQYSRPYLPAEKALGEMTLNAGKVIAFYNADCHGVIDISPFACMNGIISEVVYPNISEDHHDFPVKIFYFDGASMDLDRDLEIFMDQVRSYRVKSGQGKADN